MQQAFSAATEASPEQLFAVVSDLNTYPQWLDLVDEVQPSAGDGGEVVDGWFVTLKGRVGPFSRSKRLRMIRTEMDGSSVRYERQELDGREHSDWLLAATVKPAEPGNEDAADGPVWRSEVSVSLSYGGSMWSGLLDGVLDAAATRATEKLQAYVRP